MNWLKKVYEKIKRPDKWIEIKIPKHLIKIDKPSRRKQEEEE